MGTEESNKSAKPCEVNLAQNETRNKPLHMYWSTSIQGHPYSMSTPTPFINSYVAGSCFYPYIWPNQLIQAFNSPLQYDSLHDKINLENHHTVDGGSALTSSDEVQMTFSVKNLDSMKPCDGNLQPRSSLNKEFIKNGKELSVCKTERDGVSWSAASGGKGSSDEALDNKNGFPSSRMKNCNMMLANGKVAKNGARMENCNVNCVNETSASQQFAVDSTEPNLNSRTGINASGASPRPSKAEEEEIRKERKRQLNRESARRSRIRRRQECDELHKTMYALAMENSLLKDKLVSLSEDCLELNTENNSIEEEVIKRHGLESIADLVAVKPGKVTC